MENMQINESGELLCPFCGSRTFSNRRTASAKLGIGVAGLLTVGVAGAVAAAAAPKRMQCLGCRRYLKGPPVPVPAPFALPQPALRLDTGDVQVIITSSEHDGVSLVLKLREAYPGLGLPESMAMRKSIENGRLEMVRTSGEDADSLVARLQQHGFTAHREPEKTVDTLAGVPAAESAAVANSLSEVIDELERLADLVDRGFLTAKEYAAQKARLLEGRGSAPRP